MQRLESSKLRDAMVERQLRARGIVDEAILDAFRTVPREVFVADEYAHLAYDDHPLPIEAGQTISQPYIVALTIQAAGIGRDDTVLEVGAGSGYAAAVIGQIARRVVGIERQHELAEVAASRMDSLGYDNVRIVKGDGTLGCPDEAPFDAIVAAASGSHVPQPWIDQLAEGGRIVMPIGEPGGIQQLIRLTRTEDGKTVRDDLGAVRFVPLIGEEGWKDE